LQNAFAAVDLAAILEFHLWRSDISHPEQSHQLRSMDANHRHWGHSHQGGLSPSGPARAPTPLPRVGPKASTTPMPHSVDTSTFHGWTFSRQEDALSTLSFPRCQQRWAPVVDRVSAWHRARSPGVHSQCGRHGPLWPAVKQAFGRGSSHRQRELGAGAYHWGLSPAPPGWNPRSEDRGPPRQ